MEKNNPEAELESFRRRWKAEVTARAKPQSFQKQSGKGPRVQEGKKQVAPQLPAEVGRSSLDTSNEAEAKDYHDVEDKDEVLKLKHERPATKKEPRTALEHYEHAVEREGQGSLGDSLNSYRKAFKLDADVHDQYKRKHFPAPPPKASSSGTQTGSTANAITAAEDDTTATKALPATLAELIAEYSQTFIPPAPPVTDLSAPPPCPIASLPEELLSDILLQAALTDVACMSRLPLVCRRFAYLVMTEERIWRQVATGEKFGFTGMHYRYVREISGEPLDPLEPFLAESDSDTDSESPPPTPEDLQTITSNLLASKYRSSWRTMFRSRPRLRFGGCYISTVNYTRPGGNSANSVTNWSAPVHIVTYYRYLRFFRDGTAISLLTTSEPADVVHHLTKENLHTHHTGALPSAVMKDALRGRWRISGPGDGVTSKEAEGDVHIETEGVIPKYTYKMQLEIGNAGKGARNNKLSWKGFWSYNKMTDDWGDFGLRHDKARGYYWSRVRSYGVGA